MKLDIIASNKFRKDVKLAKKRGLSLDKLELVVETLANQIPLDKKYKDHALTGNYCSISRMPHRARLASHISSRFRCTRTLPFSYRFSFRFILISMLDVPLFRHYLMLMVELNDDTSVF